VSSINRLIKEVLSWSWCSLLHLAPEILHLREKLMRISSPSAIYRLVSYWFVYQLLKASPQILQRKMILDSLFVS
jgi:hypothetical protein